MQNQFQIHTTPVGPVCIVQQGDAIVQLSFGDTQPSGAQPGHTPLLTEGIRQLDAYFSGTLREFSLPLRPSGTEFQRAVWQALTEIPYGETRTYGEIAHRVGNPRACRAVGSANHCNPIAIVVPCHRVIGVNGKLTGYAGGLHIKQALLALEQRGNTGR